MNSEQVILIALSELVKKKNILVCPLDWGLGHATRMVPIIDLLLKKNANVIIGADKRPLAYLKQRFPNCEFITYPGYSPNYPTGGSMALAMIRSYPEMKTEAKNANKLLQKIIDDKNIDVVISDNRYELYSNKVYSVFITHQLNIQTPGILKLGAPFVQKIINNYIQKFNELWIPDVQGEPNLSGVLSHVDKFPVDNTHFIGPLSRFSLIKPRLSVEKPDLVILLSGPEPQRTILEEKLIKQVLDTDLNTIILQGKTEENQEQIVDNIQLIPHLPDEEIAALIKETKMIITRPGYSTVMDLAVFGKKAVFIPTPGQTEQEYLAKKYENEGICYTDSQNNFKLKNALKFYNEYSGQSVNYDRIELEKRIDLLLIKNHHLSNKRKS